MIFFHPFQNTVNLNEDMTLKEMFDKSRFISLSTVKSVYTCTLLCRCCCCCCCCCCGCGGGGVVVAMEGLKTGAMRLAGPTKVLLSAIQCVHVCVFIISHGSAFLLYELTKTADIHTFTFTERKTESCLWWHNFLYPSVELHTHRHMYDTKKREIINQWIISIRPFIEFTPYLTLDLWTDPVKPPLQDKRHKSVK